MTGQTSVAVATGGAVASYLAGGPLAEVFNQLALTLALMGGFGGLTMGLAVRLPWRDVTRSFFVGGLLAAGLGAISPVLIERLFGISLSGGGTAVSLLASGSFMVGFGQDVVVKFMAERKKDNA